MKARSLKIVIFAFLFLGTIAVIQSGLPRDAAAAEALPPGIGERCNHFATYTGEIPAVPGRENAYAIDLPAEPGSDVVVCTAFMWDSDGQIYHFGFDVDAECQSGFCVAGMDLWKHYYDGKFWFWWQDPPASGPPTAVEVWLRRVNPRENTPGPPVTPTPLPTVTPTDEPTPPPTPVPTGQVPSPPDPKHDPTPTQDLTTEFLVWLPLVQN
ncbi:MAG TPA: hypothetical protein VFZ76_03455 [Anaerolineales bacterium]